MPGAPASAASGSKKRRRQLRQSWSCHSSPVVVGKTSSSAPDRLLASRHAARSTASGARRRTERVRPVFVDFRPSSLYARSMSSVRSRTLRQGSARASCGAGRRRRAWRAAWRRAGGDRQAIGRACARPAPRRAERPHVWSRSRSGSATWTPKTAFSLLALSSLGRGQRPGRRLEAPSSSPRATPPTAARPLRAGRLSLRGPTAHH
jgi:hypothetical protein